MSNNIDFRHTFNFVCSLFQKDLWQEVANNYDLISEYFLRGDMTKKNSIQVGIINYLHVMSPNDYDVDNFYSYLVVQGKLIKEEALELCKMASEANSTSDKSKYDLISKQLRDIAYSQATERAKSKYSEDPVGYVNELKKFDYRSSFSSKITVNYLDQFNVNELQEEYLDPTKVLPSSYDFINSASCLNGYPTGQIIAISSPPGGGKTLFMMKECFFMAANGFPTVYIALADMNIVDFYVRAYSLAYHVPFEVTTVAKFKEAYEYGASFHKDLAIIIAAANEISMRECVDFILNNLPNTKVVFADYDSQFSSEESKGTMYDDAVEPYVEASRLKKAGITTFMAGQPRTAYYSVDYLDLNSLGESSKKQHVVDFMITIGTNDEVHHPCGYIAMPKARRVFNKFKIPYVRTSCGNMVQVPFSVYNTYRAKLFDPTLTYDKLMLEIASSNSPASCMGGELQTSGGAIPLPPESSVSTLMDISTLGNGGNTPPIL